MALAMPTHLKIEIETASRRLNTSSLGPTCQLRANRAFTPDSFSTGNPWPDFGSKDRLQLTEDFNALPASERCPVSPSALPPARVLGGLRIDFGEKCDCFDDVVGVQKIPTLIHVKESKPLRTLQRLDQPSRRRSGETGHRSSAAARSERGSTPHGRRRQRTASRENPREGTPPPAATTGASARRCRPQGQEDAIAAEVPSVTRSRRTGFGGAVPDMPENHLQSGIRATRQTSPLNATKRRDFRQDPNTECDSIHTTRETGANPSN